MKDRNDVLVSVGNSLSREYKCSCFCGEQPE